MLADTFGRPVRFGITPGQASDIKVASDLLEGLQARAVLADKAYDGNDLREHIAGEST
ncbi:transposase [Novosphingobium resinovorum]|uniref:transposase n=1 Tax=Novosphingobium resinovorum TaxID=158500 RepID=UPI002ED1A398